MALPLEDFYEDVIGKAQRGLGFNDAQLLAKSGISREALEQARAGVFEETSARKLAQTLSLGSDALVACGNKSWHPNLEVLPKGFWQLTTDYKGVMTVNAYVAQSPSRKEAILFDTGASATPVLELLEKEKLSLAALLITHGHGDHIADVDKIRKETQAPVYAVEKGIPCDCPFQWGEVLELGGLFIDTHRTTGHADDGTTFRFDLGSESIAVVGDALFSGSMGGANDRYQEALECNRKELFSLSDATWVCPGHGPVSKVGLERVHNPFFA
ncbi:MAG: MBL fold metallo-hydrolase [Verrucomicrobiota bacterium]